MTTQLKFVIVFAAFAMCQCVGDPSIGFGYSKVTIDVASINLRIFSKIQDLSMAYIIQLNLIKDDQYVIYWEVDRHNWNGKK